MNRRARLALAAALALVPAAGAQPAFPGFQTPSGNIHCAVYDDPGPTLRCDVLNYAGPRPPKPRGCDLDWGSSFFVAATGRAAVGCVGDTVADPRYPRLAYGRTWALRGFSCASSATGLRCTNRSGHGFALSRASARTF